MATEQTATSKRKTAILVGVTVMTVVLGVIAVVTALRLRQLSREPVAPTAPQSQPQAQDLPTAETDVCISGFNVAQSLCLGWCNSDSDCGTGYECVKDTGESAGVCYSTVCDSTEQDENCQCPTAEVSCQSKVAYLDTTDYTPGDFGTKSATELKDGDQVQPGDIVIYTVTLNSSAATGEATVTDILPPEVTLLDVSSGCVKADNQTVDCTYNGTLPVSLSWRVQVNSTVTAGSEFTNEVYVNDTLAQCSATLTTSEVVVSPTPTGTPGPSPTPTPTGTPGPTATNTPGPTATPTTPSQPTATPTQSPVCGDSCVASADCGSGLTCSSGVCRNVSCTQEADCVCDNAVGPTATPVPPAPTLPTAGVAWPTMVLIIGGGLLLLIGITGFLVW